MSGSLEAAHPWLKDFISTVNCNQWSDLGVKQGTCLNFFVTEFPASALEMKTF